MSQVHGSTSEVDPLSVAVTIVTLDLLCVLGIALVNPEPLVLLSVGLLAAASAGAMAAIFVGRVTAGVLSLIAVQLAGQIGVVVALGHISILPLFASTVVLLAAATLGPRGIAWVLAMALLVIGIEAWLDVGYGGTRTTLLAPVMGGIMLTVAAAVISMLDVRETERAMGLAAERDRLRRLAVETARASEERYRLIADNVDDWIALLDEQGHAEYVSPSYRRRLGGEPDGEVGLLAAVHAEDRDRMLASLRQALADGQATATLRFDSADGRILTYEVRLSRVLRGERHRVAVIGRDVTVRLALEEEVRKAQRMEALDRLAGGIAHDFNNLLAVVSGAAEMAAKNLNNPTGLLRDLQIVGQALESAKGLTQQLLTFSRKQVATPQVLEVGEVVRGLSELIRRILGGGVQVTLDLAPDCSRVRVPRSHLEQVIMNFAANARDAMPEGGTFRLATRRRELEAEEVPGLRGGSYVEIAASDTGTGIAPDVVPHLFEPFFTTKSESRGTGLGLATAYGIARQSGGTILVESLQHQGCTFRVLLPVREAVPAYIEQERTPPATQLGQRVLLVDDDPAIIHLVRRMLSMAGFEVVTASTRAEAERELAVPNRPFHALVTDVMLGSERGTALVPCALAAYPRIRIVVISGYAPEPEATAALLGKQASFLAKPFDRRSLLAALGSPTADR